MEISNPGISCAVRRIIKNPMNALTDPKVRKFTGMARNLNTAPIVAFTKPSTTATIIAVINPFTLTHGVKYAAIATARPETRRLIINHMTMNGYKIKRFNSRIIID